MAKTKATHLERSSYLFRMITYHLNSTCNMILNQTDEESELLGTTHIKNCLEHQHQMGSFEAILDGLDTLAIKIYNNVPTEVLESENEADLYDYIQEQFRNSYLLGRDVNDFVFTVLDKHSDEVLEWDIQDILDEINRDRPEKWVDYTKDDWFEGWSAFCEDADYVILSIEDKGDVIYSLISSEPFM